MIFLQATVSDTGPAAALFRLVEAHQIALVVSAAILAEVHNVLTRPKVRRKHPSLSEERIAAFLTRVRDHATLLDNVPSHFVFDRDPKDTPYLDLAIFADATYLVSRDRDLLDLMEDIGDTSSTFRQQHP